MENLTHANKVASYSIGRPNYPNDFYEYVCKEIVLTQESTIADIGCGTGKITKGFLERGIKVFTVEPDQDMFNVLEQNLKQYSNCVSILSTAENTKIQTATVDCIFCGNSYHWFDRNYVIPEFKRIVKNNKSEFNIIITSLGPSDNVYTKEYNDIDRHFAESMLSRKSNTEPCFLSEMFISKTFEYVVYHEYYEFLHGSLSASSSPVLGEANYEEYCDALKKIFEKYSIDGKIESKFKLNCMVGNVKNLAY